MAGLLGFDRRAFLDERDPAQRDLDTAMLNAAAKIRREWAKELGGQIARAIWGD